MFLSNMIHVFMQGGPLMWPLVLIVLVLYAIVLRTLWHLFIRGGSNTMVIQSCLDGLLFWGGFAVIIGVLGSAIGYSKALTILAAKGTVNPEALLIGTAEGMVSSIAGLFVLAGAGACWYLLRWRFVTSRHAGH